MVWISGSVDASWPLISENYLSEMKFYGVLTTHEGFENLRLKFVQGVYGFDCGDWFVELEKKLTDAAELVHVLYLVSDFFVYSKVFTIGFRFPRNIPLLIFCIKTPMLSEIDHAKV